MVVIIFTKSIDRFTKCCYYSHNSLIVKLKLIEKENENEDWKVRYD
jgi:hypothetical protein